MLRHLARVLEQVAEDADAPVASLRLLDEAERARLLDECGRKDVSPPPRECIHARFEARAERTPHAVAVTCADGALTYAELNARANRLAHRLRALGVGPETRVGVALERSAELVAALLAVLKAGGAYVPLDPAYPADRIAFVLDDAGVPVLITARDLLPRLPSFGGAVLRVDDPGLAAESGANPGVETGTDALAYVIYTSGSTGRPKGVQVTHANVLRLFDATEPGSASARATCGRSSTPAPSTSPSGRSGARCSTAAGWWSSPSTSPARPRTSTRCWRTRG
jgi:non-ribosomal peptide synthetase component F